MTDDEIRAEWDAFIEYPDDDRLYVTTASGLIFARVIAKMAAQQEREACAKLCDAIEEDRWNLYKGRPPYTGSEEGRANPHTQGESIGAEMCAAAIRARGEK